MSARIRWRRVGSGRVATITLPTSIIGGGVGDIGDGAITVAGWGSSIAGALKKAATVAKRIADDPVMRAILPPQAQAAIVATQKLATAAKRGKPALRAVMRSIRGPGKKRLAKALAKEQTRRPSKMARRAMPRRMPAPPPPRAPMPTRYADEYTETDEDIMNTPPPPDIAPVPEDALGPMPAPEVEWEADDYGDYADEYEGEGM